MAAPKNVELTLVGYGSVTVVGHGQVKQYQQISVDMKTAEIMLGQFRLTRDGEEKPIWEEGVVAPPKRRARTPAVSRELTGQQALAETGRARMSKTSTEGKPKTARRTTKKKAAVRKQQ